MDTQLAELAMMSPEDIIFLLFHKELPDLEQSVDFRKNLQSRGALPDGVEEVLATLPVDGHPMDWLSIGIHTLGMLDCKNDWREDALNLIARLPRLLGLIFRYREERLTNIPADDLSLPLVARFTNTVDLTDIDKAVMNRVLSTYLVLHMDHGGGNLSTFAGKAVASGHATVYSSMAGAMNALSGPLHGRANQSCFEFVKRIGTHDPAEVENFVRGELEARRPVFDLGMQSSGRRTQELLHSLSLERKYVLMMSTSKQSEF